jgi:hypothetical protein
MNIIFPRGRNRRSLTMAVLSADKNRPHRGFSPGKVLSLPLAGYTNFGAGTLAHTVYKGSLVVCDISDTDGYFRAVPLVSGTNMAADDVFGGIALERVDVTSTNTADGSKSVSVARDGVWGFPLSGLAATDIGAPIYASDDDTPVVSTSNTLWIGVLVGVDATYAWVDIGPAAGRLNSAT